MNYLLARRGVRAAVAAGVLATVVAACGSSGSGSSTGSGGAGGPATTSASASAGNSAKPVKIAFLAIGTGNTYADAAVAGAQAEARKLGASMTVLNGNFDPQTQLSQCQQVSGAAQDQAVVLFAVAGPALKPCGPMMQQANMPLVSVDQPLGDSTTSLAPNVTGLVANVGQPPQAIATNLVNAAVQACTGLNPCNIAWFRTISSLPQSDSVLNQTLQAALKQHPNMKVVAEADTPLTVQGGYQQIQTFAQKTKAINVILSYGAQDAIGAVKGLKDVGLKAGTTGKDVRIIANGGSSTEIADVRNGSFYATTITLPRSEGADAVQIAVEAARGQKHQAADDPMTADGVPIIFTAAVAKAHPGFKAQWTQ